MSRFANLPAFPPTRAGLIALFLLLVHILLVASLLISSGGPVSMDADSILRSAETARYFYDSGFREPLFPFLTRLLIPLAGDSVLSVRLVSAVSSVFSLLVLLVVGERLIGRAGALIAAALFVFNPFVQYYSASGDRMPLLWGLLLLHFHLLFRARVGIARSVLLAATGALLPLLRTESLLIVLVSAAVEMGIRLRARQSPRPAAAALIASLLLFAPYPVIEDVTTGDPFYASSMHARFWANHEFYGTPLGMHDTLEEVARDGYRGGPLSPSDYILSMHGPGEIVSRYIEGYILLAVRYLPRYALPHPLFYLLALLGIGISLKEGRFVEVFFVLLAHFPFAFIYSIDQIAPGSGVEARFAMGTVPFIAIWASSPLAFFMRRRKISRD